jgi:DNA repair exonuclease SbcCD ATPase subunit
MNELEQLTNQLDKAERQLERQLGEAKALAQRAKDDMAKAKHLEESAEALEEAIGVLNSFADKRQKEAQKKIEGLVTHGLQTIFGDDLSFHIITESKARRQESRFVIRSTMGGQVVETSILDARGGGVAAVAGFLLRLIVTLLHKNVRHFFVLDEAFGQLSAEYEPKLAEFLRELVDKTDAQIVLITHSPEFEGVADTAYRFTLKDGRTLVSKLK